MEEVAQENGVPAPLEIEPPPGVQIVWNGTRFMFRARSLGGRNRQSLGTFGTLAEAVRAVRKGKRKK